MQQLIIDTNIYAAFKRNDPVVLGILRQAETIAVNTVVIGELLAGFKGGNKEALNRKELDLFLDTPRVQFCTVEETTAEFFALIFNNLKQAGKPIPVNDIWIAASAMQHGRTLLTLDSHFSHIAGLSLHPALERK
ncbi:type II toxin-antitoxin system VapC family toxin [Trichlorobacter lovleyi]|uniref:type II toxin-antitoxin system VapC family toxin n=1 Tax=Trichlorobacter lovleyi TaxID=313985 RepID=UPI0023F4C4C6|nr:type II toxin-antitoxin system VapC family toxin [Trichlorobacter lovleyi]